MLGNVGRFLIIELIKQTKWNYVIKVVYCTQCYLTTKAWKVYLQQWSPNHVDRLPCVPSFMNFKIITNQEQWAINVISSCAFTAKLFLN